MLNLDTDTRKTITARIDEFIINERPNQPEVPDTQIMMPELKRVAEEYNVDLTDLFIMYMDHIAITNKRIAQEAEEEMDFSKIKKFY